MLREYFVDTWFFIAFSDPHDEHYRRARGLAPLVDQHLLVTTDAVLTELLAFFAEAGAWGRSRAVRTVRTAMQQMDVVATSGATFDAALTRYEERPDKEYSLVDCMSMVVMEQRGIRHVLTNDHRFAQAGFVVVNQ